MAKKLNLYDVKIDFSVKRCDRRRYFDYIASLPDIKLQIVVSCECGAAKAKSTHATWCPMWERL